MSLLIDWCDYEAAKYACERWHYAHKIPTGKLTRFGVWENDKFIGCVIFGRGANNLALKKYGLDITQGCELMRVALSKHTTPVTRIIAICIKLLSKYSPELKIIISYADPAQGHEGIIYRAGNWQSEGLTKPVDYYLDSQGNELHWRLARFKQAKGAKLVKFYKPGKHKYVYFIDKRLELKMRDKHSSDVA